MHKATHTPHQSARAYLLAVTIGLVSSGVSAAEMEVTLSGDQEVPAVTTTASGEAQFIVNDDMSLSGSVQTEAIQGTAAHIHAGAAGENGPVMVPLTKKGDNEWIVPDGTKLTDAQMNQIKAGDTYVNVHSAAHQGGEIRAQLK